MQVLFSLISPTTPSISRCCRGSPMPCTTKSSENSSWVSRPEEILQFVVEAAIAAGHGRRRCHRSMDVPQRCSYPGAAGVPDSGPHNLTVSFGRLYANREACHERMARALGIALRDERPPAFLGRTSVRGQWATTVLAVCGAVWFGGRRFVLITGKVNPSCCLGPSPAAVQRGDRWSVGRTSRSS